MIFFGPSFFPKRYALFPPLAVLRRDTPLFVLHPPYPQNVCVGGGFSFRSGFFPVPDRPDPHPDIATTQISLSTVVIPFPSPAPSGPPRSAFNFFGPPARSKQFPRRTHRRSLPAPSYLFLLPFLYPPLLKIGPLVFTFGRLSLPPPSHQKHRLLSPSKNGTLFRSVNLGMD